LNDGSVDDGALDEDAGALDDGGLDDGALDDGALDDGGLDDADLPGEDASWDDAGSDAGLPGEDAATPKLGPPYPIVLAHGLFGFRDLAEIGLIYYFNGVPEYLTARGEVVYTTEVDPFNDSDVRGAALAAQIEAILETDPHEKVIVIGHSQGGIDARVAASLRPDLIEA